MVLTAVLVFTAGIRASSLLKDKKSLGVFNLICYVTVGDKYKKKEKINAFLDITLNTWQAALNRLVDHSLPITVLDLIVHVN